MDNTLNPEQELGQHEESGQEVPTGQSPELQESVKKEAPIDPLKKLQDDLAEARDKYVRLYAEFENHRRRTAREKLEMIQGANEQLLRSLLPILDDFERAEKSAAEKHIKDAEGFSLIQAKFRRILEQSGVVPMNTPLHTEFNADLHEAITQLPVEDSKLKGKVIDVVEKGYLLQEKVIRFAKVVVGA